MLNPPDWMINPPKTMEEKAALLHKHKDLLQSNGPKGMFLKQLLRDVQEEHGRMVSRAREIDPLAFFKPSYEQMLILNCWMYGISFICIYSANRIGKTTACIINFLLWILPNKPAWRIFRKYIVGLGDDIENADNPRAGTIVQVFPRPDISCLKKIKDALTRLPLDIPPPDPYLPHYDPRNARVLQWLQNQVPSAFTPAFPKAPWNSGGTVWFGAPDQDHHEQILFPLWKQYVPAGVMERYVLSDREMTFSIRNSEGHLTCWELIGKSFESKDTKWSSGAVDAILLTEGVTPAVLKEVKLRFKDPGIGSHDFTPYEPANSGAASALAQKIYKGSEKLPLRSFVFTKFTVFNAPRQVMSEDKRKQIIEACDDAEGRARLHGEFYTSSMLVLSNLDRDINLSDLTIEQMFQRFPTGRIYRGLDPGLDHPTSCAWGLLLPTNIWLIYRIMSEAGLTIPERCKRIIELSNNSQAKVYWGDKETEFYLVETHTKPNSEIVCATACDYHTFKQDETTGMEYATNYQTQGLNISESVHTGPEDRAINLNGLLRCDEFTPNLATNATPGPKIMFLKKGQGVMAAFLKWEEFYWDRIRSGDNKGQPKDKIPTHGDDELDAVSYLTSSPYRWTNWRPPARIVGDSEPERKLIQASQAILQRGFATVAKAPEIRYFGQQEPDFDDDDE